MTHHPRSRPRHILVRLLLLGCFVNLVTGCFVPQPVEETPAPATDIQVRLTEGAARRVSLQAGRALEGVSGRVLRVDDDSLVLAVRWREIAGGSTGRPGADIVRLARSDIEQIQRPRFSLSRTLMLGGVVALAIAAFASGFLDSGGGSPDDGSGGGPPNPQ